MSKFRSSGKTVLGSRSLPTLAALAICIIFSGGLCLAQGPNPNRSASKFYPDSSDTAEAFLRNAASHARDGQWAEAIEIYQRIIEQYGDKVAKLPREQAPADNAEDFFLFVDLRRYCQRLLAALPPEARAIYRERIDGLAERWYRQGKSERDPALLRRVAEQAFCSSWGDDALELLGDLAFQEGRFGEALGMYRQLVLDRPDDAFNLVHPDPSVDLAGIAAKKLLCRAASGENLSVAAEIEAFNRRFPNASGSLAGRKGSYATILTESLASDHLAPPSQPDGRWPTFAGAQTRTKVVPDAVDVGSLQWRVGLERIVQTRPAYGYAARSFTGNSSSSPPERLLAYHPIVLGDQVIVCDGSKVQAFNLNDRPAAPEGSSLLSIEPDWKYDSENGAPLPQATRFGLGIPRYTLTAHGHRVFARLGAANAPVFMGGNRYAGGAVSSLVALDWSNQGKLLWMQKSSDFLLPNRPHDRGNRSVNFEGTPVADSRNVYLALTDRREQTDTYVACFDAETGARRWVRYLGAASSEIDNFMAMGMGLGGAAAGDYGHRLLTLDGPILYYQTNLGAVVAMEAETGAVRWVATYPRQDSGRMGQGSDRDLNPAIVHENLVIVAPSDSASIYAFDTGSGRLVWKTEAIADEVKLCHLLGVAKGRLVATGDRVLLFDVKNGKLLRSWPDAGKSLEGYGRGLLAGDRIYWPTHNEIQILDQSTGLRAEPPIKLLETYRTTGGNLVAGDGYLIVAQADALVVFCQNSRLIERYRDQIAQFPDQAATYYRLARAAEAIGRDRLALESFESAVRKARAAETIDGFPLADAARDHQFRLLIRIAGAERRQKHHDEAAAVLESAAKVARSDQDRLRARLLLADVQLDAGRAPQAVEILGQLLTEERLRPLAVSSDDGHRTIRADLFIADRLATIVRERGRHVYDDFDRRARELYERGRRDHDARVLEEVSRTFPVAEVVPDALLALGAVHESASRPGAAAMAYKRLLALSAADQIRARALWRLAHVYERQNLLVSARESYFQLLSRYPKLHLEELGPDRPLAEHVSKELSRSPLAEFTADRPRPAVPLPMVRRWHWESSSSKPVRIIAAEGTPPAIESSRLFLVERTNLSPVDPATGEHPWSSDLGEPVVWVGYLSDRLLAASAQRVFALDLSTGKVQWRFGQGESSRSKRGPDPFAKSQSPPGSPQQQVGNLHGFQLVGGRLFCLRGQQELIALDGDTGFVDWSYAPRGSEINPRLWIGPERIVLQNQKPNHLLVLQTDDGRQVARCPLDENELLERAPYPIDEDHVVLVPDRRTVKMFDLDRGQFTWLYRESTEMPVNGPPRVFGDAEHLLVLHEGRLLVRLDPVTGSKRWASVVGTEDLSERPEAMACDDRRFYCASRQSLRALSMEDGSSLWSYHLTGPQSALWSLSLTESCVVAYPTLSSGSEEELESLSLVMRRRDTGALVQRFVFPATIADVSLRLDSRGALVATSRALWALGQRPPRPDPGSLSVP